MQHERSHDLHVIRPLAEYAERRFPCKRKRFRQNVIKRFPIGKAFFERLRLFRKIFVAERLCPFFFCIHLHQQRPQFFYITLILRAE